MTKKDYILKVLDKVQWHRNKEADIRKYITTHDDTVYIEYLYQEFRTVVNELSQQIGKKDITNLLGLLDAIHTKETLSKQAETKDLDDLELLIKTI